MRTRNTLAILGSLLLIAACEQRSNELTVVLPESDFDQEVAKEIADLFGRESTIELRLTESALSEEAALDALADGTVDVALVSNSMPYQEGVATVIPLYPTVLHVGHSSDREISDLSDLLRDARVFAGPVGSASRLMFRRMVDRPELGSLDYTFVGAPDRENLPDVFVVFAPVLPELLRERIQDAPQLKLVGMGPPESVGTGSTIDAATLLNPYLRPFVIPVGTYGAATPDPVLTLAVDKILLARRDLRPSVVYDLINEVVRLRPALAASYPGLFRDLTGDFDASQSTFVLHPGAQAYLQRDAPSVYERYSGIAEVVVTIFVALASATFAGVRIYRLRRKNRIDTYYSEAIRLRNAFADGSGDADRQATIEKIRALQNEAFSLLVDEKLAADESFRIFITLSNDVVQELAEES